MIIRCIFMSILEKKMFFEKIENFGQVLGIVDPFIFLEFIKSFCKHHSFHESALLVIENFNS